MNRLSIKMFLRHRLHLLRNQKQLKNYHLQRNQQQILNLTHSKMRINTKMLIKTHLINMSTIKTKTKTNTISKIFQHSINHPIINNLTQYNKIHHNLVKNTLEILLINPHNNIIIINIIISSITLTRVPIPTPMTINSTIHLIVIKISNQKQQYHNHLLRNRIIKLKRELFLRKYNKLIFIKKIINNLNKILIKEGKEYMLKAMNRNIIINMK